MSLTPAKLKSHRDTAQHNAEQGFSNGILKAICGEGFSPIEATNRYSRPTPGGTLVKARSELYPESGYECLVVAVGERYIDNHSFAIRVMHDLLIGLYRKDIPKEQKHRYLKPGGSGMTYTVSDPWRKCKVTMMYDRIVIDFRKLR